MNAWRTYTRRNKTYDALYYGAYGSKARPYEIPTGSIPEGSNSRANDVETWPQILRNGREDTPTGADSSPVNAPSTIQRVSDCPLLCWCALKCIRSWKDWICVGVLGEAAQLYWRGMNIFFRFCIVFMCLKFVHIDWFITFYITFALSRVFDYELQWILSQILYF